MFIGAKVCTHCAICLHHHHHHHHHHVPTDRCVHGVRTSVCVLLLVLGFVRFGSFRLGEGFCAKICSVDPELAPLCLSGANICNQI